MKKIFSILAAALLLAPVGCRQQEWAPLQTLSADVESITAPAIGAGYQVNITANTAWKTVTDGSDWVLASMTESTGNGTLKLSVSENASDEVRSAVVSFVSKSDPSVSCKVAVVQSGRSGDGYVSVSVLRAMEQKDGDVTISDDVKVKGFVTTSHLDGNWFDGCIAIQDSFKEGNSGINVKLPSAVECVKGSEVEVSLSGAVLGRNDSGVLTLTVSGEDALVVLPTTVIPVSPVGISYDEFITGAYESMYVMLEGWQVADAYIGAVYSECPVMENENGDNVTLAASESSSFGNYQLKDGSGHFCGIAAAGSVWPTTESDVLLNGDRIGVIIGIESLPYVFSFTATGGSGNTLKYITASKGSYDGVTKTLSNWYYDEPVRAALEVRMAGRSASDTRGTLLYSHTSGADNIPAKSFVSEQAGGDEFKDESYYKLQVPLLMDLPSEFELSFGLAAWKNSCHKTWKIMYSDDDNTWHEGATLELEVSGDTKVDGSNVHVQIYTFTIVPEIAFESGDVLYIKIMPYGTEAISGSLSPWGCDVRMWGAIAITAAEEYDTARPSGNVVYFEPFDNLVKGVDYLYGAKLGHLLNIYGAEIGDWTPEQASGLTGSNVGERPGYAQIGILAKDTHYMHAFSQKEAGSLVTPALGTAGDLELSFKALAYSMFDSGRTSSDAAGDLTDVVVEVIDGGSIDGASRKVISGLSYTSWETYSLRITGATAATRIRFTSDLGEGQFARWFIDDITVIK